MNPTSNSSVRDSEPCTENGVLLIVLTTDQQVKLKCKVGQHLFIDKTWTKVDTALIMQDLEDHQNESSFWNLRKYLKKYKSDEILMGYEPFRCKENEFAICITEEAKNSVLEKLQIRHNEILRRIQMSKKMVAKSWKSRSSELEIKDCQVSDLRDVVSYEWIGDICARQKNIVFQDLPDVEAKKLNVSLTAHHDDKFDVVRRVIFHIGVQATPALMEQEAQTHPTIPTNACTQYAPESQVAVTSDQEKNVELQELDTFCSKFRDELNGILSYNEVYDLYHDDYPALVKNKENIASSLIRTYVEYQCLNNVTASEGKRVSSIAWHTSLTGVLAVAYVSNHHCETKHVEATDDSSSSEKSFREAEESDKKEPDLSNKYLPDHHEIKSKLSADQDPSEYEKDVERLKSIQKGSKAQTKKLGLGKKLIAHVAFKEHLESKKPPATSETSGTQEKKLETSILKRMDEVSESTSDSSSDFESSESDDTFLLEDETDKGTKVSVEQDTAYSEEDPTKTFVVGGIESSEQVKSISIGTNLPPIKQEAGKLSELSKCHRGSVSLSAKNLNQKERKLSGTPKLPFLAVKKGNGSRQGSAKSGVLDEGILKALGLDSTEHLSPGHKAQSCDYSSSKSFESGLSAFSTSLSDRSESDEESTEPGVEFEQVPNNDENFQGEEFAPQILEPKNPVLIWSFDDDLKPKLCLDSPYELQCIKFCPHNGNLLAGGSVSGVVVLWDLCGKLGNGISSKKKVKEKSDHMLLIENLMKWQKDTKSWEKLRPTAVSDRNASHAGTITCLDWVYPLIQVTFNGKLKALPSWDRSLQLVTGSSDGTLKVWDLKCDERSDSSDPQDKPKVPKRKMSVFKQLSKDWLPIYTLKVINNKMMLQPVSKFHFNFPYSTFKRVSPSTQQRAEALENQIPFLFDGGKITTEDLSYEIVIATGSDFGLYSWEGSSVEAKTNQKEEFAKRLWFSMIHDDEIVSLHRSACFTNIIATAGGHIIALWHVDYEDGPIWWKRYPVRVTCIQFSQYKPTLLIVSRADGCVEIFDLIRQSHEKVHSFFVSGKVITEIAEPLLPHISGLCAVADYNGVIRVYNIPPQYSKANLSEIEIVREFLDREPERRRAMIEWNSLFQNDKVSSSPREVSQDLKKDVSKSFKTLSDSRRLAKYREEVFNWYTKRRGSFPWIRKKREEWHKKEEKYVFQTIIDQKKVNRKEMTVHMKPIIQEEQEKIEKYKKAEERIKEADNIFRAAVNFLFPNSPYQFVDVSNLQKRESTIDEVEQQIIAYFGPNNEEPDEKVLNQIKDNPWIPDDYDWGDILEKHDKIRSVFNHHSRKRDKQLRWLRRKLIMIAKEESCPIYKYRNHYERYLKKKIINRYNQLDKLKKIYGPDYDISWTSDEHIRKKLMSCRDKSDQFVLEPAEAETFSDLEITPPGSELDFEINSALEGKEKSLKMKNEKTQEEQLEYLKSLFSPSQLKNYKSSEISPSQTKRPVSMLRLLDAQQLTSVLSQSILVDELNELMIESEEEGGEDEATEETSNLLTEEKNSSGDLT